MKGAKGSCIEKSQAPFNVALSVGVQKMIRADRAAGGVIFTLDTENGFRDVVFVTSAYGLGENVVQGRVQPDEFYVFKPTLRLGYRPLIWKRLGSKALRMVYVMAEIPSNVLPADPTKPFTMNPRHVQSRHLSQPKGDTCLWHPSTAFSTLEMYDPKIGFACIKPANGSPLEWRLWADRQSPAAYRLERRADAALFGHTVAARVA